LDDVNISIRTKATYFVKMRDFCLLLLKGSSPNLIDYSPMILVHMIPLFVLKETVI